MVGTSATPGPLAGLTVLLQFGGASSDLGRTAVSFAGMMAAQFGAAVLRAEPDGGDPMRQWPPLDEDGASAVFRFLTAGTVPVADGAEADYLLTDDPGLAAGWPDARHVLVCPASSLPEGRPQSDLTLMAASGLLDVVGEVGRPPLALPGFQLGYMAGLSAFLGLMSSYLSARLQGAPVRAEISAVDVAAWANWKQMLPNVSGAREAGIGRVEEWFITPCRDGFVAPVFLDNDVPNLAELTGSTRLRSDDFATQAARKRNIGEFTQIVTHALAGRTRDDILSEAADLSLPFSAVLTPAELRGDPQMKARRFIASDGADLPSLPVIWNGERLGSAGGGAA